MSVESNQEAIRETSSESNCSRLLTSVLRFDYKLIGLNENVKNQRTLVLD